jgi:hypothetical protein
MGSRAVARRWKTPALGIHPPAVFARVKGKNPFVTVKAQDGHRGSFYCMKDRKQLRAFAVAILTALDEYEHVHTKRRPKK